MSDDTSTSVATRQAKPVDMVRGALERMRPQLAMALPKHLTADRLLRVAMTAIQTTPRLLECDRTSLYSAIMTCAQLGLEPDGVLGQAFLVPYAGRVQFVPGYKGFITLARNSGEVVYMAAREVYENDGFEFDQASGQPPIHPFSFTAERGKLIGFYAIAKFRDGSFHCEPMTIDEIKAIRDQSQGYKASPSKSPWTTHFNEMAKKTCIRRLAKYLPLSVQKAAALAESYDTGRHATLDSHGEILIEGDSAQEVEAAGAIDHYPSRLDQFENRLGERVAEPHIPPERDSQMAAKPEGAPAATAGAVETGGHAAWIDNLNALMPREDHQGELDWKTYVEGALYLIGQASRDDLTRLSVARHPQLTRLRDANSDLYRSVIEAIAARNKTLASGQKAA